MLYIETKIRRKHVSLRGRKAVSLSLHCEWFAQQLGVRVLSRSVKWITAMLLSSFTNLLKHFILIKMSF